MTAEQEIHNPNRSHSKANGSFEEELRAIKRRIIEKGDLGYVTVNEQLNLVEKLCEFPLGRFILERKGANGFWTDYMISHPENGKVSGLNIEGKPFTALEEYFLNRCPVVVAHQERFRIFQCLTQNLLKENVIIASIPCGLMRDLLTLDFSEIEKFKLIGIDIDSESLELANNFANARGIKDAVFIQEDAWKLQFLEELDVITSSGLNVYESNPKKVRELYLRFYSALKPGGYLVISVLTYPPGENIKSDWILEGLSNEDLLMNQILHRDILDIKWRNFRSSNELEKEFLDIGFSKCQIFFDRHHIFPTILAQK